MRRIEPWLGLRVGCELKGGSYEGRSPHMYAFSVYLFVVGVFLAVGPNTLLALVGLPETNEVWIRILGIVSLLLALYYFDAARNNSRSFFAASILGRGFSTAALVVFWATGHPWQLLIFASVEGRCDLDLHRNELPGPGLGGCS